MNCTSDSMLKKNVSNMLEDIIVFSTSKTLNERFTPEHPRCVFIVKEGYGGPFKNNFIKERIKFKNPMLIKFNKRFSLYGQANVKETVKKVEVEKKELKQKPHHRSVILPSTDLSDNESSSDDQNKEYKISTTLSADWMNSVSSDAFKPKAKPFCSRYGFAKNRWKREVKNQFYPGLPRYTGSVLITENDFGRFNSWPYYNCGFSRYNSRNYYNCFSRYKSRPCYKRAKPFYSSSNPYFTKPSFLYKWKPEPLITKQQLDDDIDRYMSEVKLEKSKSTVEGVDSFLQRYLKKNYLNLV